MKRVIYTTRKGKKVTFVKIGVKGTLLYYLAKFTNWLGKKLEDM